MSKTKNLKSVRKNQRTYLSRDFDSLRAELQQYAQIYFNDKISDFSENGIGGMFIEMAAYIGDSLSYYLDHQFSELNIQTAVESQNVERLIEAAGVKIKGPSPSTCDIDFYLEAPAIYKNDEYMPDSKSLPIIRAGTIISAVSGIKFELGDDLNFTKTDNLGKPTAEYKQMKVSTDSSGNTIPTSFSVKMTGTCKSGILKTQTFEIPDSFTPFRKIVLAAGDITEIISVTDSVGNDYYEVGALTQDVVYKRVLNVSPDSDLVPENIELIPAPYRFISKMSRQSGKTTLTFGGGSAQSTDSDIIPDPSEVAISLFGDRKTFSRFTIDPNSLLETRTLGIAPRNTTITVTYRAGGGLSHNVPSNSVNTITKLITKFSTSLSSAVAASVRSSIECTNPLAATGGEAALTLNEYRATALAFRNSQSRIVTKEDLVARIYSMPSNFGRVFRVGIHPNPNNPLSSTVSIISRNSSGTLIVSPDTLKNNLSTYINSYRLISDAIDIVDAAVINVSIEYGVVVDSVSNKSLTIQNINKSIKKYMAIENFQIDQPIITSEIIAMIINTRGVVSLVDFSVNNMNTIVEGRFYSPVAFSVSFNTDRGIIRPPPGSIFEMRYPDDDIVGHAR